MSCNVDSCKIIDSPSTTFTFSRMFSLTPSLLSFFLLFFFSFLSTIHVPLILFRHGRNVDGSRMQEDVRRCTAPLDLTVSSWLYRGEKTREKSNLLTVKLTGYSTVDVFFSVANGHHGRVLGFQLASWSSSRRSIGCRGTKCNRKILQIASWAILKVEISNET